MSYTNYSMKCNAAKKHMYGFSDRVNDLVFI